ncbi:unnamed protein product, partial [Phaeothamnion confervicola]
QCGQCSNCFYSPTNACFVGWTKAQCDSVPAYTWCGGGTVTPPPAPTPTPPTSTCPGTCGNCFYPPTNACFSGWTKAQCDSVAAYTWCGGGGGALPTPSPTVKPPTTTTTPAPTKKPTPKPTTVGTATPKP